jgi:hypothetical protein
MRVMKVVYYKACTNQILSEDYTLPDMCRPYHGYRGLLFDCQV